MFRLEGKLQNLIPLSMILKEVKEPFKIPDNDGIFNVVQSGPNSNNYSSKDDSHDLFDKVLICNPKDINSNQYSDCILAKFGGNLYSNSSNDDSMNDSSNEGSNTNEQDVDSESMTSDQNQETRPLPVKQESEQVITNTPNNSNDANSIISPKTPEKHLTCESESNSPNPESYDPIQYSNFNYLRKTNFHQIPNQENTNGYIKPNSNIFLQCFTTPPIKPAKQQNSYYFYSSNDFPTKSDNANEQSANSENMMIDPSQEMLKRSGKRNNGRALTDTNIIYSTRTTEFESSNRSSNNFIQYQIYSQNMNSKQKNTDNSVKQNLKKNQLCCTALEFRKFLGESIKQPLEDFGLYNKNIVRGEIVEKLHNEVAHQINPNIPIAKKVEHDPIKTYYDHFLDKAYEICAIYRLFPDSVKKVLKDFYKTEQISNSKR